MANEGTQMQEQQEQETDYIEAIKNLKENTVDKAQYENLKAENKKLLQALVEGGQIAEEQLPHKRSIQEIEKDLMTGEHTNLEYAKIALEHRDACLEAGRQDPFVGSGPKFTPSQEDFDCAAKVAKALQDCIDYAQDDPDVFTNELQRITKDVYIPKRR